jgi:ATP phosphoribosyltransferase regulatory subunit
MGIERILLALERQGLEKPKRARDIYLSHAAGKESQAVEQAGILRQKGKTVELALNPQDKAEATKMQQAKGYSELVYLS